MSLCVYVCVWWGGGVLVLAREHHVRLFRSVVETCNMAPVQLQHERHGRKSMYSRSAVCR